MSSLIQRRATIDAACMKRDLRFVEDTQQTIFNTQSVALIATDHSYRRDEQNEADEWLRSHLRVTQTEHKGDPNGFVTNTGMLLVGPYNQYCYLCYTTTSLPGVTQIYDQDSWETIRI